MKIKSDDNKMLYENVENKIIKIKRKEFLKFFDDVIDQEFLVGNGYMIYEDVILLEDDYLYEIIIIGLIQVLQKLEFLIQLIIKLEF